MLMQPTNALKDKLIKDKEELVAYMLRKIGSEDWHGVADAAMDIREIDAKLELLTHLEHV